MFKKIYKLKLILKVLYEKNANTIDEWQQDYKQ